MSNRRRAQLIGLPRDALAGPLLAAIATPGRLAAARLAGLSPEAGYSVHLPEGWRGGGGRRSPIGYRLDPTVLVQQGLLNIIQGLRTSTRMSLSAPC